MFVFKGSTTLTDVNGPKMAIDITTIDQGANTTLLLGNQAGISDPVISVPKCITEIIPIGTKLDIDIQHPLT